MTTIIEQILSSTDPKATRKVENQMRIAALIDDARVHNCWTRREFAEEMSCSPPIVTKWLSGSHNFTIDTLSEIEVVLGIDLLPKRKAKIMYNAFVSVPVVTPRIRATGTVVMYEMNNVKTEILL